MTGEVGKDSHYLQKGMVDTMYKKIMINQCGYLPYMQKKVTFVSDKPVEFAVLLSSGKVIFEGIAE